MDEKQINQQQTDNTQQQDDTTIPGTDNTGNTQQPGKVNHINTDTDLENDQDAGDLNDDD